MLITRISGCKDKAFLINCKRFLSFKMLKVLEKVSIRFPKDFYR